MRLLIVLLGSNPLPVYVTIKALTQEASLGFDKLMFVYSENTHKFLPYLLKALGLSEDLISYCNLRDNQRRPQIIKVMITDALALLAPIPTAIHFNHTGGTKTMAIHGFTAIRDFAEENCIPLTISDLDPDIHKLNVTQGGNTSMYPANDNYLDSIQCTIEDLTGLHGFSTRHDGLTEVTDPYLGITLQDFFGEELSDDHLGIFPKEKFHSLWKEAREWPRVKRNHANLPDELRKKLKISSKQQIIEHFSLETLNSVKGLDEPSFFANLYDILDFVDGKWLEYFVFTRVQALMHEGTVRADQVLLGHIVELGDTTANRDCELDVCVMKGYQLTLISCTTSSSISTVKQKAFEAVYRAHQLGGEQAKVLVVSMMSAAEPTRSNYTLKSLDYDLTSFDLNRNVFLAGKEHLQNSVYPHHCPDYQSLDDILNRALE